MRYAAGTRDILERFFNNKPLKKDDVIVEGGKMAAQYDEAAKDRNMEFESVSPHCASALLRFALQSALFRFGFMKWACEV